MCRAIVWGKMVLCGGIVLVKIGFVKYYGTHHVFVSKEVLLNNVNSYCGKAHKLYVTLNTLCGLYLVTIPKAVKTQMFLQWCGFCGL